MMTPLILLERSQQDEFNDIKKISQTRNGVGHMSRPKLSGLTYLVAHLPWAVHVMSFDHRWWPYLVSLDLSIWNFSNNIDGIVIGVLMCLHSLFSFFLFFSLFLLNFVSNNFIIWESQLWHLCTFQNYSIFPNYFLYSIILLICYHVGIPNSK
jgi:hypothetical protein